MPRIQRWLSSPHIEWIAIGSLTLFALLLRLLWLDAVPPGVRYDELLDVQMAQRVQAGDRPIYFAESWGHEPIYHYMQAVSLTIFGTNVLGGRGVSILAGALSACTTYLIARRLFGRRAAALATWLTITSFWSLMFSRLSLRTISMVPWTGLALWTFWRGLDTPLSQKPSLYAWFALSGLCQAALFYTYFPAWMMPLLLGTFSLYLWLWHRPLIQGRWVGILISLAIGPILVSPMLLYIIRNPQLGQRVGQMGGMLNELLRNGNWRPLLNNAWQTLWMFGIKGDIEWFYNISGQPLFDPLTAALFGGGLILSLWQWRDPRRALALLWLAAGLVPTMVTWPPGSLPHSILAQSVIYMMPAWGAVALGQWLERCRPRWKRWPGLLLGVGLACGFGGSNLYDYFVRWPRFETVRHQNQAPVAAVAHYVNRSAESLPISISAPYIDYWNPWSRLSFDLLLRRPVSARWFNGTTAILFPAGDAALFFLPDHLRSPTPLHPLLNNLLLNGAMPVEVGYRDAIGSTFDLYRYENRAALNEFIAACAASPAWASLENTYVPVESEQQRQPLTLPIPMGNRLAWLGYQYLENPIAPNTPWQMATCWQVLEADNAPLSFFVHILDHANTVRASQDGLSVSPHGWQAGDVIIHIHTLIIPADVTDHPLRVELGVYSPVTLERLSPITNSSGAVAPQQRVLLAPLTAPPPISP